VDVDPSDTLRHEPMRLDELQDFLMIAQRGVRQGRQECQDLAPSRQGTAGEFADHEGMSPHFAAAQAIRQEIIASAEVIDPDGGIDEH
jgi:hypothetical protein